MCVLFKGEKKNEAELLVLGFPLGGVRCGDMLGILQLKLEENSFGTSNIFPKSDFNHPSNWNQLLPRTHHKTSFLTQSVCFLSLLLGQFSNESLPFVSHGSDSLSVSERPSEMRLLHQHLSSACMGWFKDGGNQWRPRNRFWPPCENSPALGYPGLMLLGWHEAVVGGTAWTSGDGANPETTRHPSLSPAPEWILISLVRYRQLCKGEGIK